MSSTTEAVTIRVPASTSNLGAGFDTFGLALALYLDVMVEPCEPDEAGTIASVEGEGADELPTTADNVINEAYQLAATREGVTAPSVRFSVRNEIPVTRGLGSSAAAAVAGLAAFEAATGRPLSDERLIELGDEMEGHPDNIAASTLGGFVSCCAVEGRPPVVVRGEWPAALRAVLVIPDVPLPTSEARRVLPDSVPRADAIYNLQRATLFQAALAAGRWDALGEAMRDRLHQPYREHLLPGLAEVFALEPGGPLVGVAMSGAGSAVIALATDEFEAVGARIARCFVNHDISTTVRVLDADPRGRRRV